MADSRKIVKVFLASPGDLPDERRAAKSVVDEYNALTADEFGYQVELVGWEDTVSVFGRPQATINRDLERCELFLGLMWKKWGTPPDVSGPYSSGFEEEFETSVQRRLSEGRPEISLLFKEIDPAFLGDPGEDLKKVLAFKERLVAEKRIYFEGFADIPEFEKKIRRCIWNYVQRLRARDIDEASVENQAPTTGGEKQQAAETASSPPETPLSIEGAKFLREFISKTERSAEEEPIVAVEIARFRLLASLVGRQGNDDRSLGVHDANLIFSEGGEFTFGYRELAGLVATGFQHYTDENTPLWRWFAAIDGFARQLLPIYSIFGSETKRRTGALAAMRLIAEPLPSENHNEFLDTWFATESPSTLKVVALGYLGDCGISSDLASIRKELDEGDNQTVGAAADAIIRINLRDSREKGVVALYELQPTSISRHVLEALFDNETALSTETLMRGVGHRYSEVRRIVVELLRGRRALTNEMAEQLMNDSDAAVRYDALMSLVDGGRTFSDEEAKRILVTQARSGGIGLLGLPDFAAEQCLTQFREQRLRSLKDKELEEAAAEASIFDQTAEFVLAERHFNLRGEELRRRINDQYKATFSRALDTMIERYGSGGADIIEKARALEEFTRKNLTRSGLDIICRKGGPGDLGLVRSALKSGFVDYSATDIEYLRRFGEWEDIPLIITAVERPEAGPTRGVLWSGLDDSKYRTAARAIYALGRTRLPEVLAIPTPSQLLAHLVAESSDKVFRNLNDTSIMLLLRSEGERVRKAAALKCVRALSKGRMAKLLASYVSGKQSHYYNVVHWLDFGVSTPRERALLAAERVLNEEWRK